MNQLFALPLYLYEINTLTNEEDDENGLELVLGNDLSGSPLIQFFPSSERYGHFADLVWDDEGAMVFKMGKFQVKEQMLGGRIVLDHPTFVGTPFARDEVDIKSISVEPLVGRLVRVRLKAHFWDVSDVAKLVGLLHRECTFSALWAKTDADEARDAGQLEMGLPRGEGEHEPTQAEIDEQIANANALLSPRARAIVDELHADEAAEQAGDQIPVSDSRVPVEGAAEAAGFDYPSSQVGKKEPQKAKRAPPKQNGHANGAHDLR